jgi:hypothetical protein
MFYEFVNDNSEPFLNSKRTSNMTFHSSYLGKGYYTILTQLQTSWIFSSQQQTLELFAAEAKRLVIFSAVFGFPFILPSIYSYLALPKDFVEIRNEDMEGYSSEMFFDAIAAGKHVKE